MATAPTIRTLVLVEGDSDAAAIRALADLMGCDLASNHIQIRSTAGVTNYSRVLADFVRTHPGADICGMYDVADEWHVRRALANAVTPIAAQGSLESLGFFACVADLEDELIRALGADAVERVLEAQDELKSFRRFQAMPQHRGTPVQHQLRRFLGTRATRKIRSAPRLVEALDPTRLPQPLAQLAARLNSRVATKIERTRGEGPGVITQDGCAVEVYRRLPYRGELEVLAMHLPPKSSVLDLGCGTGRLTQRLLENGHSVTAVDNSPDMLRHVPDAASKVCCDIERLALDRTFDVVLFASNLINVGEHGIRRAQLEVCRRHLAPAGAVLFQRFDPAWLRTVQPGPFPSIGDVEIFVERATHHEHLVHMSIRYGLGMAEWKQHFTARVLDDDDVRRALSEAGFDSLTWVDARWGVAKHG